MIDRRALWCFLLLAASVPLSAQDVGDVVLVRNTATGQPAGGSPRPLRPGDGVALGLTVATGADSALKMTFDPQGAMTFGERTRAVIDRALVDRATGRSDSALSVLAGSLRLALGRLFRGDVEVSTPTAVVGVKGTDVRIEVLEGGLTIVSVVEGEVSVAGKAGGQVQVRAGHRSVIAPGKAPTLPAPIAPGALVLSASAGGPAFSPPQTVFPESPALEGFGEIFTQRDPIPQRDQMP